MLTCSGRLQDAKRSDELHERVDSVGLGRDLDNAVVGADIEDLATELVREEGNVLEMLVLLSESLADGEVAGVEVLLK